MESCFYYDSGGERNLKGYDRRKKKDDNVEPSPPLLNPPPPPPPLPPNPPPLANPPRPLNIGVIDLYAVNELEPVVDVEYQVHAGDEVVEGNMLVSQVTQEEVADLNNETEVEVPDIEEEIELILDDHLEDMTNDDEEYEKQVKIMGKSVGVTVHNIVACVINQVTRAASSSRQATSSSVPAAPSSVRAASSSVAVASSRGQAISSSVPTAPSKSEVELPVPNLHPLSSSSSSKNGRSPSSPLHKMAPPLPTSLMEEAAFCLSWLHKRPPNSVIYVSLGSVATINQEELREMARGLAKSGHPFLWVVRPSLLNGSSDSIKSLPEDFKDLVPERGWCWTAPQRKVLEHPAVGGFFSHCGWNSTLESLCGGVPMICRPCFADQMVNARYLTHVWRVGVELESVGEKSVEGDKGESGGDET
ncbi:hypothetical protein SASPL_101109 [Salvia splendens]|uniref:Glycosyltransferase n=1 Tax=Salvia splendens TaxID=180675 RepID=A0A8X8YRB6_SALSN|nr:hypothetical protein SASPL_101109 [Salvia splendens]